MPGSRSPNSILERCSLKIARWGNGSGQSSVQGVVPQYFVAFAVASNSHGTMAMGINTSVSFVKAAVTGNLYAEAREQSRNPRLASYSVRITDDVDDVVAIFQGMVYRKKEPIIPANYDFENKQDEPGH